MFMWEPSAQNYPYHCLLLLFDKVYHICTGRSCAVGSNSSDELYTEVLNASVKRVYEL